MAKRNAPSPDSLRSIAVHLSVSPRRTLPVLLLVLLAIQEPPIRLVPQIVDPHFAQRHRMCVEESTTTAAPLPNEERRSVQEFLGPTVLEYQIHQLGDSLRAFAKARDHLRTLLRARPRSLSRLTHWAEGTPFSTWGILGTIRYAQDRAGRIEVVGNHLCVSDSTGGTWWLRLEAMDVWPEAP